MKGLKNAEFLVVIAMLDLHFNDGTKDNVYQQERRKSIWISAKILKKVLFKEQRQKETKLDSWVLLYSKE